MRSFVVCFGYFGCLTFLRRASVHTRALSRDAVKAVERGADVRQAVLVKNAMIKKTLLKVRVGVAAACAAAVGGVGGVVVRYCSC